MMTWITERLAEPSTWRGLVYLLTVAGLAISPDLSDRIVQAGLAVAGLLLVANRERQP